MHPDHADSCQIEMCLCLYLYPLLERGWLLSLCACPSVGVATALGLLEHHSF